VGGIRLDAKKSWVTSAGQADVYIASTLTPEADTVDLFAVPADTDGVEITGQWKGLGYRGNASSPMTFTAEVPESYRLGPEGGGLDLMLQTVLPWFNLGNAAVSLGLSQAAVAAGCSALLGRSAGAPGPEPVGVADHPRPAGQDVHRARRDVGVPG
jgi:alkylation response protein AidB-like acyl-CoA dehydrogenase